MISSNIQNREKSAKESLERNNFCNDLFVSRQKSQSTKITQTEELQTRESKFSRQKSPKLFEPYRVFKQKCFLNLLQVLINFSYFFIY